MRNGLDAKYDELSAKYRDLNKQRVAAGDKYLELRDAKSNGCLGWNPPIWTVVRYDEKIQAAAAEITRIQLLIDEAIKELAAYEKSLATVSR